MNSFKSLSYIAFCTAFLFITLSSCAANTSTEDTNSGKAESKEKKITICTEPRPQICTREYNPVCATLNDGSVKTYATGCTACSDTKVIHYMAGVCPQDQ